MEGGIVKSLSRQVYTVTAIKKFIWKCSSRHSHLARNPVAINTLTRPAETILFWTLHAELFLSLSTHSFYIVVETVALWLSKFIL